MSAAEETQGFFEKILSILVKASDPEKEKKRQLREIAKQLKKHKYKFYRPKTEEALSAQARFFYDIYRVVGPAGLLLDNADTSAVLKTIIIENTLTDQQVEIRASFEESEIKEAIKKANGDVKAVASRLKGDLVSFFALFDNSRVSKINETYNLLSVFLEFISFDYYFFLRKFDSRFPENDFNYNPRFEDINGEYVSEDLKDFLVLIPLLELDADWDYLFDVLASYKGAEVLNRSEWAKILRRIRDVRASRIFELIVKHIDKDPAYSYKYTKPSSRIVEDYLTKIKNQVELTIQKILQERKGARIDGLAQKVFGTHAISRMKFYTDKANLTFSKKMLGGYVHVLPMNYLKAFLVDYCKKDIREAADILLIRGKWTTNISSQQLSEAFYGLMAIAEKLIAFDESLSDEGEKGAAINKLLKRRDSEKANVAMLRKLLKEINDEAAAMINETGMHLITLAKSFKMAIDDYNKKPHELLTNWKEIEAVMDGQVAERFSEIYRKCYYFVQLLQHFVKK